MPKRPQIPSQLDVVIDPILDDSSEWERCELSGELVGEVTDGVELSECRIKSLRMTGAHLVRSRVRDCRFEQCELSGAIFEAAAFERVEFVDCRLSGAVLSDDRLRHVRFHRCRMDGIVLRMASTIELVIQDCQLPAADLYGSDLSGSTIVDSDLSGADISNAQLSGAKLHGTDLADVVGGGAALRDVQIDAGQVVPVALLVFEGLGISITERPTI
ncbi:MAG: hypothetical protein CL424_06775 [Acidimicrobiaceae bacterium]|nr:hypothetical protein [Acidimicrobiaceae bacterium]